MLIECFIKLSMRHKIKNKQLLEILMCKYEKIFTLNPVASPGLSAEIMLINQCYVVYQTHALNYHTINHLKALIPMLNCWSIKRFNLVDMFIWKTGDSNVFKVIIVLFPNYTVGWQTILVEKPWGQPLWLSNFCVAQIYALPFT